MLVKTARNRGNDRIQHGANSQEWKISVENMPIILAVKQIAASATSFKLHVFLQPDGTLSVL